MKTQIDINQNPAASLAIAKENVILAYLKECLTESSFTDILGAYRLLVRECYEGQNKKDIEIDLCELQEKIRHGGTPPQEQSESITDN